MGDNEVERVEEGKGQDDKRKRATSRPRVIKVRGRRVPKVGVLEGGG